MRTAGIREGDLVKCDIKGRVFLAEVRERQPDGLFRIRPVLARITYTQVSAHQIVGHYRKARGSI